MSNLMFLESPVNLISSKSYEVLEKSYEVLENQLWNLSDALEAAASSLKLRAVRAYEELNVVRYRLLNFLNARGGLKRSRLSKLLKILGIILSIVMGLHAVSTGGPIAVVGTIATFAFDLASRLV